MAFNENLSNRIREALSHLELEDVTEKYMFGGVCYMVNDKMCIGVMGDEIMCRIDEETYEVASEKPGCRGMEMGGRQMKGYLLVGEEGMKTNKEFQYWIDLCLEFNPRAKASKKKKS